MTALRPARTRLAAVVTGVALAAVSLAACGSDNNTTSSNTGNATGASKIDCATGSITASGSTAQANAMSQWVKDYQSACSGATINYQGVGSGAGIQQFTQGSTAFAGSDSALKDTERPGADGRCKTGKAIDLPMVPGPIAVAYNISGVDSLTLTPKAIAGIFDGTITKWNDPAIAASNSGATLPSTAIQAFHRSDSSGTTDNFTKYLDAAAKGTWTLGHDKVWKAKGGQGAKGSDGVAGGVKGADGGIGYMEFSFAKNAGLKVAKIDNGGGAVELTTDNVSKAVEAAQIAGTGNDLALKLDYTTQSAYPILLVTYEITCEKGLPADQLKLVKSFLTYTVSDAGQKTLTDLGYAPLPSAIQTKVKAAVDALS